MTNPTANRDFFDSASKVLLRCWLFGFALLLVWSGVILIGRDFVYGLHGDMFGLTEHELALIFYCGIVFTKVVVLLFFFFPWAAIRLVLRGN
jgi:hypothetical protein